MHTDHMGVKQYRYEYMYVCPDYRTKTCKD